jgi:hypothetical protein
MKYKIVIMTILCMCTGSAVQAMQVFFPPVPVIQVVSLVNAQKWLEYAALFINSVVELDSEIIEKTKAQSQNLKNVSYDELKIFLSNCKEARERIFLAAEHGRKMVKSCPFEDKQMIQEACFRLNKINEDVGLHCTKIDDELKCRKEEYYEFEQLPPISERGIKNLMRSLKPQK